MTDVSNILRVLAIATGYRVDTIKYGGMARPLVPVRHVAYWLLRHLGGASFPEAARALGGHDHSTAIVACRKVEQDIANGGPRLDVLMQFIEDASARARAAGAL
jgi:chromosomal replication initiation ATPase DnaA